MTVILLNLIYVFFLLLKNENGALILSKWSEIKKKLRKYLKLNYYTYIKSIANWTKKILLEIV